MSTALNVFQKAHPMVVTEQEIIEGSIRGSKMAAEVNAKNAAKRGDDSWRAELEDLTRRLVGMPTVEEAQARLDNLKSAIAGQVKEYRDKIAECRMSLGQKFLSPLERTHISQKIEEVSGLLLEFEKQGDFRLRLAEGRLKDAQTWNPHRERWQELRKRAKAIEAAIQV